MVCEPRGRVRVKVQQQPRTYDRLFFFLTLLRQVP